MATTTDLIPILVLQRRTHDPDGLAHELRRALEDVVFFYVVEHDVARFTEGIETSAAVAAAVAAHPVLGCCGVEVHPALRLGIVQAEEGKWLHWGQTVSCGSSRDGHPIHLQAGGRTPQ